MAFLASPNQATFGYLRMSQASACLLGSTNQNQKTMTIDLTTDLSGPKPSIHVNSATVFVQEGDLFLVGDCTDTICLIPVSDILDPIAQKLIPTLQQTIVQQVQAEADKVLASVSDIIRVPIGTHVLEFNGEGSITFLPDGSLVYTGSGATLADVNGNFVTPPVPNTTPLPNPASLPAADFKVIFSEWTLSAFFWAAGKTGALDMTITQADLPSSFPVSLNTDSLFWDVAIPGFMKYPHLNITLSLTPISPWPAMSIKPSATFAVGPVSFALSFNLVNGTKTVLANAVVLNITASLTLSGSVSLQGTNAVVAFSLTQHSANVTLISSTVGSVSTTTFGSIINVAFSFVKIPPVQFALPSQITVSSLVLDTSSGYAVLLVDGSIKPPSTKTKPVSLHPLGSVTSSAHLLSSFENVLGAPEAEQICGYGEGRNCQQGQTCCNSAKGGYSCCPLLHATCCSDGMHCCPEGTGCVDNNSNCAPWG